MEALIKLFVGLLAATQTCQYVPDNVTCTTIDRVVGCFDPATEITMADQTVKPVSEIEAGDMVWNPVKQKAMRVAKRIAGPEEPALIEIGYGDSAVRVTEDHPMMVENYESRISLADRATDSSSVRSFEVKRASEISKSDAILGADGKYHPVTVLRRLPPKAGQIVVNIELESDSNDPADHAILADGVVTGDLKTQIDLKKDGSI